MITTQTKYMLYTHPYRNHDTFCPEFHKSTLRIHIDINLLDLMHATAVKKHDRI